MPEVSVKLEPITLELFLYIAGEARHWDGTPPIEGLNSFSPEDKNQFTQLKKLGLLVVDEVDRDNHQIRFTRVGVALAAGHGVKIRWSASIRKSVWGELAHTLTDFSIAPRGQDNMMDQFRADRARRMVLDPHLWPNPDQLTMKRVGTSTAAFGVIASNEARPDSIKIHDIVGDTEKVLSFESIEDLIAAGWTVD